MATTHNNADPYSDEAAKPTGRFRKYLPDLDSPRFVTLKNSSAYQHVDLFNEKHNPPWLYQLYVYWRKLLEEPYRGVTTDGIVRPDLFPVQDESVPVPAIAAAANHFLSLLTPSQRTSTLLHIDSPEWRTWSNPEFYFSQKGVRLEELPPATRAAALSILEATLSPEGYAKAVSAMRVNHFLGELCAAPGVMNEWSYNVVFFGTPSADTPWGFQWYGHHLCLNIFLYRNQLTISPWFTGAEPNEIDSGPHAGTRILHVEEALGLQLMQSLPQAAKDAVQVYKLMHDPAMPPGRWNDDDQRHLCGAYRDNRIVPYEGLAVDSFTPEQQALVWAIVEQYLLYLPQGSRDAKLAACKRFVAETYFCWIGGYGDEDPFYFRVQSPVVIVEFDHHSGVLLSNKEPGKFHIHTVFRTPNAGDYGMALRKAIPSREDVFVYQPGL